MIDSLSMLIITKNDIKNNRVYINEWFDTQEYKEGDKIYFEMPGFCSGDYEATVYIDNDGDPYIDKKYDFSKGCRDYEYIPKIKVKDVLTT